MPIQYPDILKLQNSGMEFSWTEKETMLYALGVGMGADPMNEQELPFVYERNLKAMPTLASVVAWGAGPGNMNINFLMVVDGERTITFHKPMPGAGTIMAESRVVGAWDKGKDKGAVITTETVLKDKASGEKLVTLLGSTFARGDGGFGGPTEGQPEPHAVPKRAPDTSVDIATLPNQALLYRLSGDRNPLHSDPEIAKRAGFPRPILHGMCTYGISCRAVLQTYADYDPARFKSHGARFSAPVFPGETITVDLWKDGNIVSFEAKVKSRNVTVIKSGRTELA
ncbi:MAG: MaoC family dehydratase N-terminal domain-containing protein [Alphaproteobacteria bacterium]|nr:MaoC family dehydratase N-terminal domain-containing protein [Alphaproteobacteria bacterium]